MNVAGRRAAGLDAIWAASERIGHLRSASFVCTGPKAPTARPRRRRSRRPRGRAA